MPRPPWERSRGLDPVLRAWRSDPALRARVALDHAVPPREGRSLPLPEALPPALRDALRSRSIDVLHAHQHAAWEHLRAGRPTLVSTPTASGKSLCFHLPVLQRLVEEPTARALYLLPSKALAQDQERSLRALLSAAGLSAKVAVYDGDTASDARRDARERASIVLTNPDMLHAGILPHHAGWGHFFGSLRYVVLDELHACTGIFGAHVSNVMRRLARVARFHGSSPVMAAASATLANPAAHAARVLGVPDVSVVAESGAPSGPRAVMVVDPPFANETEQRRVPATRVAVRLAADLVRSGVRTLVFGGSRSAVETMTRYLRETLAPDGFSEDAVTAYRAGYLPATRRRIEGELREGGLRCVVATSALELGVDVGDIDAVVCAGWPGTLAALWQRFGRAGRRRGPSLGVLVPGEDPIDRYVARHPDWIVRTPVEEARVDPDNVEILLQHLQCAVFELPFADGEGFGSLAQGDTSDALSYLGENGRVHRSRGRWHWVGEAFPAETVSLRTAGRERVQVIDRRGPRTLAELDLRGAMLMAHEGAVYQHEGEPWVVERLDLEERRAYVAPSPHDWFTEAQTRTELGVLDLDREEPLGSVTMAHGEVSVVTQVTGYRRVRFHTHEPLGNERLSMPELETQTAGCWVTLPDLVSEALLDAMDSAGVHGSRARLHDGLRGAGAALRTVASLALMCNHRDLGASLGDVTGEGEGGGNGLRPTLFVYDQVAGGAGLSEAIFERRDELFARARELVEGCPCPEGCPACVGPGLDGGVFGRKSLAGRMLTLATTALPLQR